MTRRIVLWDIDHTLIENSGVSKRIYAAAFEILTGHPPKRPARTEGRSDQRIMADLLAANGWPEVHWAITREALIQAGHRNGAELAAKGYVLPGVFEVLEALHGRHPDVLQTVVTGNIYENAVLKLGTFGLIAYLRLDAGGYGSDHASRAKLVAMAIDKVRARFLDSGEDSTILVVGDTPRDVRAGHSSGATVLAVASGVHTADELVAAGADHVVPDLGDTAAVLSIALGDAARD